MVANLNNCLIRSLLTFLSHPQEKRSTQFVKRNLLDFVLGTGKKWWAGRSKMFQSNAPFPGANGQPQLERDWLVAVPQRDGSVIFMIFVAPQSEFAQFESAYEAMLKSVEIQ